MNKMLLGAFDPADYLADPAKYRLFKTARMACTFDPDGPFKADDVVSVRYMFDCKARPALRQGRPQRSTYQHLSQAVPIFEISKRSANDDGSAVEEVWATVFAYALKDFVL